jgi:hypothetical protein
VQEELLVVREQQGLLVQLVVLVVSTLSIGHNMNERKFAIVENNKVINVVINIEEEIISSNPEKYIEYTDGWDYENGIDGGDFFPK